MNDRIGNKIELEVAFGDKKAIVKILSLSWLSDELIVQAIDHIIEQNNIEYDSVISESNRMPSNYPATAKFIETKMLKNDIEIYIYYFREVTPPRKRPTPHIPLIFYIILFILMLIGVFAALIAGVIVIFTT